MGSAAAPSPSPAAAVVVVVVVVVMVAAWPPSLVSPPAFVIFLRESVKDCLKALGDFEPKAVAAVSQSI